MKNSLFVLALVGLGLAGCMFKKSASSGGTAATTYSCMVTASSFCMEYATGFTADTAQQACINLSGTYAEGACDTADLVGSCEITTDGVTVTTRYYSTIFTAVTAESSCTGSGGTFTAAE